MVAYLLSRTGIFARFYLLLVFAGNAALAENVTPVNSLAQALAKAAPDIKLQVLTRAVSAMQCAINHGAESATRLAVIDFSLPSSQPRMWLFDLESRTLILQELVAHGQGSGDNYAKNFSNTEGSHQSSLGLFRTSESYMGKHGYSLRMDGLESGVNDKARARALVIHAADYVAESWIKDHGRIGRSQGCPAVRPEVARMVIDSLKGGQFLFSYYPDEHWLQTSAYINCPANTEGKLLAAVHQNKTIN